MTLEELENKKGRILVKDIDGVYLEVIDYQERFGFFILVTTDEALEFHDEEEEKSFMNLIEND